MIRKNRNYLQHILVAPAIAMFLLITIFPLIFNVVMSLANVKSGLGFDFIGLDNYKWAFSNSVFWSTMKNTIIITVLSVFIEYVLAMVLAYNINKLLRGKKFIRVIMLLPMLMAPVVIGFMWKQLFNELYGPINYFLSFLGIGNIPWISKPVYSLLAIVLVDVWEWTPFILLILLAGFQSVPNEPIESARVDGASEWRIFKDIVFRMLIPASTVAITLRAIETFKIFDTVYIITAGGPGISSMSASMYAYQIGMRNFDLGKAAALCVIMLVFVLLVSSLIMKIQQLIQNKKAENKIVSKESVLIENEEK